MKNYFRYIIFIFAVCFSTLLQGQEILTELPGNPEVQRNWRNYARLKAGVADIPLELPFLDDFSYGGIFPSTSYWTDRYAFVNNSYGLYPPTYGVATLDAVDDTGAIYSNASFVSFEADHLTSRFIRLDSVFKPIKEILSPADSVYFSFSFQPQGLGNAPEDGDDLYLQFLEAWHTDTIVDTINPPYDTTFLDIWNTVWEYEGTYLDTFYGTHDSYFEQVLIPITDSIYFRKDFKFRFISYASLADASIPSWRSNADHWNIDYVYLNKDRLKDDYYTEDIAFVNSAASMLRNYDVMPLRQYSADALEEMADSIVNSITNLGNDTPIVHYVYYVEEGDGNLIRDYEGGDFNLSPFHVSGYQDWAPHATPPVDFSYPTGQEDSISYLITHVIEKKGIAGDIIKTNDTIRYLQTFNNYYAYDDGSAEAGYGLTPAGSKLAYRFILNQPDTLAAIRMYFNRVMGNANQQNFYLTVWNNSNNRPGDVIYSQEGVKPVYSDSLNKFIEYPLESETPLILNDTFYIGWVQTTDDNLNVGFDRHRNVQEHIYYDVGEQWFLSTFEGCLMIRPVMGSIPTDNDKTEPAPSPPDLQVYPNPVNEQSLHLFLPKGFQPTPGQYKDYQVDIYNTMGQHISSMPFAEEISVAGYDNGIYILRLISLVKNESYTVKFVISR